MMNTRRKFLRDTAAGLCWPLLMTSAAAAAPSPRPRPKVAAIFTVLRFRSHAYNILENFLGPYYFNGQLVDPGVDVVALYADQFPSDDMAREVSQRLGIPLYPTIAAAMCCGSNKLSVDAALLIGEHGDYPYNALGQHLYPRKRFFDEAVAVMERDNRFVPVFNDKHFSYRWDWAREMFDTARRHRFPLMGGSSVPLAMRAPQLDLPENPHIEEAVAIHGGGLESYDFHALEVLQSIVESRHQGETGIRQVQLLYGDAFQRARSEGRWSTALVEAAMQAKQQLGAKRQPFPKAGVFAATRKYEPPARPKGDYAISLLYNDGLRATALKLGSGSDRWNFACRLRGESDIRATAFFNGPWGNRCLFKALSHAIQRMLIEQREPYPAERTLLTTGVVEAVMHSYRDRGQAIRTPHLDINYTARDWSALRETGKTWEVITVDTPQPTKFAPRPYTALRREKE
ncbi:MAG TPA: hypothetical protein DCY79_07695 [Planctomycetaceae bacterium]|nr:hypothetical protein [Planctomycetaceae bacterium]